MSESLAALSDALVAYPGRGPALGPLSLEARPGEITALVGPSGCGKSTALRLLAGLQPTTAGQVSRQVGPGDIGMVFQAPTLAPWLTARANIVLPLRLSGIPDREAKASADAALARVGLTHAAGLKPAQLSGGMAMRTALARALVTRPRLLLLDEPFAALDALTRREVIDDVLALWSETKPGVLFVTHDVEEAVYMAHRVLVMTPAPGRIAAEIATPPGLPRSEGFRATPAFRDTVEAAYAAIQSARAAA
ncbi:ATP-binding cassette domain-containing protein [Brevundimonas sp.]|uniref:ABC transporter ATP-binding protein n=1 Tax=Brevundimonas sp. TaxID=1871086 RepID=UPI0025EA13BD|nr:ATP-binding cassette domain-containing protein [Brevundimonas sp.]